MNLIEATATRTGRRRIRRPFVPGVLTVCFVLCPLVQAAERTAADARRVPTKQGNSRTAVIRESDRPLKVNYNVRGGGTTVTVGSASGEFSYRFEAAADPETPLNPESFQRMWGTREGMGALAQALGDMLIGAPVNVHQIDLPRGPFRGGVQGVALFEDDGVTHLLLVRFEESQAIFEDIGGVAAGCSADVPGGGCGCSADGKGGKCTKGTDSGTGDRWAKCKDGPNQPSPEVANCNARGSSCECTIEAAQ